MDVPLKDWLAIIAIISALWIQSKLDERKETRKRRLDIFKTLMATRASVLSQDHIKALNMIDIEFYGDKKYKKVREEMTCIFARPYSISSYYRSRADSIQQGL
jgi:hypothetical protein